mgnify:CR=1 FL=1
MTENEGNWKEISNYIVHIVKAKERKELEVNAVPGGLEKNSTSLVEEGALPGTIEPKSLVPMRVSPFTGKKRSGRSVFF